MKIHIFEGQILEHQDGSEYEIILADRHGVTLAGQGEYFHIPFRELANEIRDGEFIYTTEEEPSDTDPDTG